MTVKAPSKRAKTTTNKPRYVDTLRRVHPVAVRVGMFISSNDDRVIKVETIAYNACSHHGTHVNGNACFDARFTVKVWEPN